MNLISEINPMLAPQEIKIRELLRIMFARRSRVFQSDPLREECLLLQDDVACKWRQKALGWILGMTEESYIYIIEEGMGPQGRESWSKVCRRRERKKALTPAAEVRRCVMRETGPTESGWGDKGRTAWCWWWWWW